MELSGSERRDLLLYLIGKVDHVESMRKLQSMVYIMNRDAGISEKYNFDAKFLTVYDEVLDRDIISLLYLENIKKFPKGETWEKTGLKISRLGKMDLNVFDIEKKLESRLGSKLPELENMMKKYNAMDLKDIVLEVDRVC